MTLAAISHRHPQGPLRRVGGVALGINTGLQVKVSAAGLGQRFSAGRVFPPGAP